MKNFLESLYQLVCFVSLASNEIRVNVSNTRDTSNKKKKTSLLKRNYMTLSS